MSLQQDTGQCKIVVVDAPCGCGKTSWAIQEMNCNAEKRYVFCTPFLDEITRIRELCAKRQFTEPSYSRGMCKAADFNERLALGENIAVTHTTFLASNADTVDYIERGRYSLILDETMDVVINFNQTREVEEQPRQFIVQDDIDRLIREKSISVDPETKKVAWIGVTDGNGKFRAVEDYAKRGVLYLVRNEFMCAVFPPAVLDSFEEIFILTYMFEGSSFDAYLHKFNMVYRMSSVANTPDGYCLCGYDKNADLKFRAGLKELVYVVQKEKMNFGINFSKEWFKSRRTSKDTDVLRKNLTNFFSHTAKATSGREELMWTTIKDYQEQLEGKGYTRVKSIKPQSEDHAELLKKARASHDAKISASGNTGNRREKTEWEEHLDCFVPCNSKGTNKFRFRRALAYCCDLYYPPMIKGFFTDDNPRRRAAGLDPIKLSEERFALSCFLQWMFRSCIRDGKHIDVYLPSKRIRELFMEWLDGKEIP